MQAQAWHNRVVTKLMVSARGDLMLTSPGGDLATRRYWDENNKELPQEVCRPMEILARIKPDGWTLTPAGCQYILENCPPQDVREVNKLAKVRDALDLSRR